MNNDKIGEGRAGGQLEWAIVTRKIYFYGSHLCQPNNDDANSF
uniref:Uncharacterized protein n=1 Tax=Meloidogyne enterolobii TaxID=390850 RepID=A0A6V7V7W3_MELEN|nr:unnamed protein product [Meloidogyne enterolobii]